jgi:hypothetical protein
MILILLMACSPSPVPEIPAESSPSDSTLLESAVEESLPVEDSQPTDSRPALVVALSAGAEAVPDALQRVALEGGWPMELEEGRYLVIVERQEGIVPRLGGSHSDWVPQEMTEEASFFWAVIETSSPIGAMYKFEADGQWWADPWARAHNFDTNGELSYVRGPGAHLERWPGVTDGVLPARTLRVWVPLEVPTHQLYLQDGQNLFDPSAPFGGWKLQESLGPSTMAIGIDCIPDQRRDEYGHVQDTAYGNIEGGRAEEYRILVMETIRPLIEQSYGKAPVVGIMGSSMGGLVSFYIGLKNREDFAFIGSLSGAFDWGSRVGDSTTMRDLYSEAGHNGMPLYLDSGGNPGSGCVDSDGDGEWEDSIEADFYCSNRQMADTLAELGWTWGTDLWHWWEPDAPHSEDAWAARVWRPLQVFEAIGG